MTIKKTSEVEKLEQQLALLTRQVIDMAKRIQYLERENSRRRGEVGQIAGHLNRK
jgi:regulator of replication initiation timing